MQIFEFSFEHDSHLLSFNDMSTQHSSRLDFDQIMRIDYYKQNFYYILKHRTLVEFYLTATPRRESVSISFKLLTKPLPAFQLKRNKFVAITLTGHYHGLGICNMWPQRSASSIRYVLDRLFCSYLLCRIIDLFNALWRH